MEVELWKTENEFGGGRRREEERKCVVMCVAARY
jgi:hypothetical protein